MKQTSFTNPVDRTKEVLKRASNQYDPDTIIIAVSGGTDSVVAADVMARYGPEYGLEPDAIAHINTGAAVPQSRLTAKIVAEMHGLEFIEQGYRKESDALAVRVLNNGWPGAYGGSPATGGHGLEWANRKDKPMNAVYMMFDGMEMWVSGTRKLESKKRMGNVPDSGIHSDKPRRVWVSPIVGWTSAEKKEYIKKHNLPVSEAYLVLGFSGECVACSFDERSLLSRIDILSPELGYAIRTLAVWLYLRYKRGDVDIAPKRLCWGWEPDEELKIEPEVETEAQSFVGCDEDSCKTQNAASWVREVPDEQIVTHQDVLDEWHGEFANRFA